MWYTPELVLFREEQDVPVHPAYLARSGKAVGVGHRLLSEDTVECEHVAGIRELSSWVYVVLVGSCDEFVVTDGIRTIIVDDALVRVAFKLVDDLANGALVPDGLLQDASAQVDDLVDLAVHITSKILRLIVVSKSLKQVG